MTLLFPKLPGMTYSVFKSPQFETKIQKAVSHRELRLAYQPIPTWLFKLKFDFLRGTPGFYRNTYSEVNQLMGIFLAQQGSLTPFLLDDPTDDYVVGQPIGMGDGTTTAFQLVRTMTNYGGTNFQEPIIAPNVVMNMYVAGIPVSNWTVNLGSGIITFAGAPANNAAITATFSYYFLVRFADDSNDFEQIMNRLWTLGEMKFQSVLL